MARREYRKSERQWQKQYQEYLYRFTVEASKGKWWQYEKPYEIGEKLTFEQFKIQYTIARQTNVQLTGNVGDVYKTIMQKGPAESRVYVGKQTMSKAQAKRLQQTLNEQENEKVKNKIIKSKDKHYYTLRELMASGGKYASALNDYLKETKKEMNSYQRAEYIGEELYGSP